MVQISQWGCPRPLTSRGSATLLDLRVRGGIRRKDGSRPGGGAQPAHWTATKHLVGPSSRRLIQQHAHKQQNKVSKDHDIDDATLYTITTACVRVFVSVCSVWRARGAACLHHWPIEEASILARGFSSSSGLVVRPFPASSIIQFVFGGSDRSVERSRAERATVVVV